MRLLKGDLVLYKISKAHAPVVKIVAAVPGDEFQLLQTADKNSWNIKVNGDFYTENVGTESKPYHFGSQAPPAMKIYADAHRGKLDSTSVILLSGKSPGDQDSGSLGVLNAGDIVGIVHTR